MNKTLIALASAAFAALATPAAAAELPVPRSAPSASANASPVVSNGTAVESVELRRRGRSFRKGRVGRIGRVGHFKHRRHFRGSRFHHQRRLHAKKAYLAKRHGGFNRGFRGKRIGRRRY